MTPAQLTAAEDELVALWNDGRINSLTHFSGSVGGWYEDWLCRLFNEEVGDKDWVLCSHRAHFHYLLYMERVSCGEPQLKEKVLQGKSMFLYGQRFIQSAIVAGLCGVAAGIALSIKQQHGTNRVWHFGSDGCEDQGAFYEAVRLVRGRGLPCTFIIEDNDRQCGVSKAQRGSPEWEWPSCVRRVYYQPKYPHAGTDIRPVLKSQDKPAWLGPAFASPQGSA